MSTKVKTVGVWDLLGSRETLLTVSDAVVTKATSPEAVKAEQAKTLATVKEALAGAETPEAFAKVVTDVRTTFGAESELARMAQATKAAARIMAAVTKVIVVEAFTRDLVGKDKHYPTASALAAAVGVSTGRVSQLRPVKDATKTTKGGRKSDKPADPIDVPATDTVVPADLPDDMATLAQAMTRLENISRKIVGTPDNAEDLRRTANALRSIATSLDLLAKVEPVAV